MCVFVSGLDLQVFVFDIIIFCFLDTLFAFVVFRKLLFCKQNRAGIELKKLVDPIMKDGTNEHETVFFH